MLPPRESTSPLRGGRPLREILDPPLVYLFKISKKFNLKTDISGVLGVLLVLDTLWNPGPGGYTERGPQGLVPVCHPLRSYQQHSELPHLWHHQPGIQAGLQVFSTEDLWTSTITSSRNHC